MKFWKVLCIAHLFTTPCFGSPTTSGLPGPPLLASRSEPGPHGQVPPSDRATPRTSPEVLQSEALKVPEQRTDAASASLGSARRVPPPG